MTTRPALPLAARAALLWTTLHFAAGCASAVANAPDARVAADASTDGPAGDGAGLTCPDGGVVCDGGCVDPMSDNENCGACGVACCAGFLCLQGTCVGDCPMGTLCPRSDAGCSGAVCVNTHADRNNCGACGNVCPPGHVCLQARCQ